MQIKQILVSVCSFCFLSITMSSFAAGTSPEIDTRPLLRIGYIESSFSPFERKGFQVTFECLGLKKVWNWDVGAEFRISNASNHR